MIHFCPTHQKYVETYEMWDTYAKTDGMTMLIVEHHCPYCFNLICTEERPYQNGTDNPRRS